jgi:chromosome segregation ATPase
MTPTAIGARLQLSPWEVPADRVVDLTRRLEAIVAYNATLEARIRELEARSISREHSIAEAVRDLEATEAELAKLKTAAKAAQDEAALYRARLQAVEKEDIETLKRMIAALEALFPAQPRREP